MADPFAPASRRALILKRGRDRSVKKRHPWVFSGAIGRETGPEDAPIGDLFDDEGTLLASGFHSRHSQIRLRAMVFGERFQPDLLHHRIARAISFRSELESPRTTAVRLVHSEGDLLSGLIVDCYEDVLVVEITNAGVDACSGIIIDSLRQLRSPAGVFVKNNLPARRLERLPRNDIVIGSVPDAIRVRENDLFFEVRIREGQKTGFFLDQRDNRMVAAGLASRRSVLNLFSYTGGFGVYAAASGATSVQEVDVSSAAIDLAKRNHELNGDEIVEFVVADAFEHVRLLAADQMRFGMVICDPPAFARSSREVDRAARGYKDINVHSMKLVERGGYLLTFSCSGHIDADLFQKIVFSAALDAGREAVILRRLGAGIDHPVSLYCPETEYLKGLLVRID